MRTTRRGFLRGLGAAMAATAISSMHRSTPPAEAACRPPDAGAFLTPMPALAWEQLSLTEPVTRLFAPASGALLAATASGLMRSDDAGASWRPTPLPGDGGIQAIEVDPSDHRVIFIATAAGLFRSDDEGASWSPLLPPTLPTLRIAVSPAHSQVVYVAQGARTGGAFAFRRSRDRGATWETLEETSQGPCGWSVPILQPHATDPARLFRTLGCYAGRDLGDTLEQSRDAGASFATLYAPRTAFPFAVVGGGGVETTRLYVAVNNDFRSGGSLLVTSPDDGVTWTPILQHTGGGTITGAAQPSTVITGLAYDPAAPTRVFVAQERRLVGRQIVEASGVAMTSDGGESWAPLGQQDLPHVTQLLLGIDGKNLFAATDAGVWRLALA